MVGATAKLKLRHEAHIKLIYLKCLVWSYLVNCLVLTAFINYINL